MCTIDQALNLTELTAAGRQRFTDARANGYLVTIQGEQNGRIDAAWTLWCAENGGVRITVHRYRGVDHPAQSGLKSSFLDLAGVELAVVVPGRCIAPRGISAIGQAFHDAGIAVDQPWSLAPHRVGVGRVPLGNDERLARALLRLSRMPTFTVAEPIPEPAAGR